MIRSRMKIKETGDTAPMSSYWIWRVRGHEKKWERRIAFKDKVVVKVRIGYNRTHDRS